MDTELDAIIVGAGFAGVYLLHRLRQEGLKAKIVEETNGLGGVWQRNAYPGARVDTPIPTYSLNIPEVWQTWAWSEEFPGEQEIKAYFRYIDKVLDISKDVIYGEKITRATFYELTNKWRVESNRGSTFTAQFFCPCLGFASKSYTPDWPGLKDAYKGLIIHPSQWPGADGIDLKGKKVAVVGTGATGLQVSQESAKVAEKLTCFVRTPNLSWPMRPRKISAKETEEERLTLAYRLGEERFTSVGGFLYHKTSRRLQDDTPEQREVRFEESYRIGGFHIFLSSYINLLSDQEGNDYLYRFWRRKTHARMTDKKKAELLAPEKPPHAFAGKRAALEIDYYEQMDKPHVTLVDVKSNPITHVVANGLVTEDGTVHEADILVLATGYDAVTGGFKNIEIKGLGGRTLEEAWKDSTRSYLGLAVSGFPNMLYTYGPLSPSAYGCGPAVIESQVKWIVDSMRKMREQGATRINATPEAEDEWRKKIESIPTYTSRDSSIASNWYFGTNVPGKRREVLLYSGGLPMYRQEIFGAITPEWKGFAVG